MSANGYRWWYVDAISDDGRHGITVIAFLGSVFSPWYAWARRNGRQADPLEHSCFHVAVYGVGSDTAGSRASRRWAMTERGAGAVSRDAERLAIGRSAMRWDGLALVIDVDEVAAPVPRRVRGRIRVWPRALSEHEVVLSRAGDHRWTPIGAGSRVEVALDRPALRWNGEGYWDGNSGAGAIEDAFRSWRWCRMPLSGGRVAIDYEAVRRDGEQTALCLLVGSDGVVTERPAEPARALGRTRWGIKRPLRSETPPVAVRTVVGAPFYARTVVGVGVMGEEVMGVHEALECGRFQRLWVQAMLPFRVPRVTP